MSASVAEILRGAGFVPVVPELSRQVGAPESKTASRVPVVPAVPVENDKGEAEAVRLRQGEPDAIRDRLLALTAAEYRDPALVRALSESFLRDCDSMSDDALRALLSMLADDTDRRALRRPKDDTAAILCRKCGPVWIHPAIAAVLPVVNGWPRALGCPWCFIPKGGPLAIPRPPVTCGTCRHFARDTVNPSQGIGTCALGVRWKGRPMYPFTERQCGSWRPSEGRP